MKLLTAALIGVLVALAVPASSAIASPEAPMDTSHENRGIAVYTVCTIVTPGPECAAFLAAGVAACMLLKAPLDIVCLLLV